MVANVFPVVYVETSPASKELVMRKLKLSGVFLICTTVWCPNASGDADKIYNYCIGEIDCSGEQNPKDYGCDYNSRDSELGKLICDEFWKVVRQGKYDKGACGVSYGTVSCFHSAAPECTQAETTVGCWVGGSQ
jgi:hypothetical protein